MDGVSLTMKRELDNISFKRLATRRVNVALKYLRLLGNLSNRSNYCYTEEQVEQIFTTLEECLKELKQRFVHEKVKRKTFNLE